jgi:hypothetical protein
MILNYIELNFSELKLESNSQFNKTSNGNPFAAQPELQDSKV